MTIRINQTDVEFTLEQETTVADLFASLAAWAEGEGLALRGILVDGKAAAQDDSQPLANVGLVEVETVPAAHQEGAQAAVVAEYFALVAQAAETSPGSLTDLAREYPAVRSVLPQLLAPLASRLGDAVAVLDAPWTAGIAPAAHTLARAAATRQRELLSPGEAWEETISVLTAQRPALADLGLRFQKGQDSDAFASILTLFTLLEDVDRRAGLRWQADPEGKAAWERFRAGLQPFLQETRAALDSQDYILLTDLLEYEILPRLDELSRLSA